MGVAGSRRGARRVEEETGEMVAETVSTCLELVGPSGIIGMFLDSRKVSLADATVIRMEGELLVWSADAESM